MTAPLPKISPLVLKRRAAAFDNDGWIFEPKYDGFRAIAYVENGKAKLVSRNLRSLRFESVRASLATLPVTNAILDR